jgi:DNA-binding MarR family transcriptional regulator
MTTADDRELAERLRERIRNLLYTMRRFDVAYPITGAQAAALVTLRQGPRRMTELADEQGVRLPTMTAQVGRLERLGYLTRGRDADDARVVTVTITDAGRAIIAETTGARNEHMGACVAQLDADEHAALAAALPVLAKLTDLLAAASTQVVPLGARDQRR